MFHNSYSWYQRCIKTDVYRTIHVNGKNNWPSAFLENEHKSLKVEIISIREEMNHAIHKDYVHDTAQSQASTNQANNISRKDNGVS